MTDQNQVTAGDGSSKLGQAVVINSRGEARITAGCDIVFVIDTTGSMSDKIAGLIASCQKFVDELGKKQTDLEIAVVAFGDLTVTGDKIVATSFSKKIEVVKKALRSVPRYSGGGNDGESSLEAMVKALDLQGYRPGAVKVFILMTDEPALTQHLQPQTITSRLKEKGVLTFVISNPQSYFKEMAHRTGGEWWQISSGTNFMSILDRLTKKVSATVVAVQTEAGGDVQKYLQLKGGN